MIYIMLLVGVVMTSSICNKTVKLAGRTKDGKSLYCLFWGILLVGLVALRSFEIGNDTRMYEYIFNSLKESTSFREWIQYNWYTSGTELGFYYSAYIISRVFDYRFFLIVMAIISVVPFVFIIWRYSANPAISFILYISFPYYTFAMSGLRQAGAMGFIAIAYYFIKEKKLFPYILFCLIAFSFHGSSLLFLPIYWIEKIPNNKHIRNIIIIGIAGTFIFKNQLWRIASLFARQQYEANEAGGILMYFFMLGSVGLGLWYYKVFMLNESNSKSSDFEFDDKVLFYLQVLAAMIWPLSSINSSISRVYYYYHMFIILYVPRLIGSIPKKYERYLIILFFIVASIGFFITQVSNPIQKYVPYKFMW